MNRSTPSMDSEELGNLAMNRLIGMTFVLTLLASFGMSQADAGYCGAASYNNCPDQEIMPCGLFCEARDCCVEYKVVKETVWETEHYTCKEKVFDTIYEQVPVCCEKKVY